MSTRPDRKIETVFRGATHRGTSGMGNPTWTLHTDDGDWTTQTNASLGYEVSNFADPTGPNSLVGERVVLTATPAGRVWMVERAKP